MKESKRNVIVASVFAIAMISCADSGTSTVENPALIGIWRRVDTLTVDIADSTGNIIGYSQRKLTYDYNFKPDNTLLVSTRCEYTPQFNNINSFAIIGGQAIGARDTIYTENETWKTNNDTLIITDTSIAYEYETDGAYRSIVTNALLRFSISGNVLTIELLGEPLKASYPPAEHYNRIN